MNPKMQGHMKTCPLCRGTGKVAETDPRAAVVEDMPAGLLGQMIAPGEMPSQLPSPGRRGGGMGMGGMGMGR